MQALDWQTIMTVLLIIKNCLHLHSNFILCRMRPFQLKRCGVINKVETGGIKSSHEVAKQLQ